VPSVEPGSTTEDRVRRTASTPPEETPAGPYARALYEEALKHGGDGRLTDAAHGYSAVITAAEAAGEDELLAQALRQLALVQHRQRDPDAAWDLCERSYRTALRLSDMGPAAEALNTLAGFELEGGSLEAARSTYRRALELCGGYELLRGRIEQNLGVLSNIQGDLEGALAHYTRSLEASRSLADDQGTAVAYHNLGMVSADLKRWDDADRYFRQSHYLAELINNDHLRGLCLLNRCEVHLACQRYDDARRSAEEALATFNALNAHLDKPDAYAMLGVVYRETGRPQLAEARLRSAIELASSAGIVLSEAEATRELAVLYQRMGRNQEALRLLSASHRLFGRLDARVDLVDVAGKVAKLEGSYLAVVQDWGQSIESADSYTHGHCERVASYALAVARALGLDPVEETAIRVGAYLHDLGKIRVPHEILNKPGPLTPDEFAVMKMHPAWGVELLTDLEFPWDIKPIIRWHHEKYDGSGYPDGLRGDDIPLAAQIICIADVYDALTTDRSYRSAMTPEAAHACMQDVQRWWRPAVFKAFSLAVAERPVGTGEHG
jgi:putative nucleotidyltransferase with HDIG domain